MNCGTVPQRSVKSPPSKYSITQIIKKRELGLKGYIGRENDIFARIYSYIDQYKGRDDPATSRGGVFNLEFSLDGKLLVAACEHNCVLIYDASTQKLLKTMERAHNDCVNCVRFLDNRTFATCSDDNTIKLWDTRNVNNAIKTLHGHSNWVKNIEFLEKENIMVTSAFDGSIYAWDLKNPTENSMLFNKVLLMKGLMRTKLTPDGTKMVLSTTGGYIVIIHDLNLEALANDFKSFKPLLYRLMQTSGQTFPAATIFNTLFSPNRKRNRVEFISDFNLDAEVISSLQIHPYGWNCVSRCVSQDEQEEMTCVHDIQKCEDFQYENCEDSSSDISDNENDHSNNPRPTDLWMGFISNHQYNGDQNSQRSVMEHFNNIPSMGTINSGLIGRNYFDYYFQQHPEDKNKVIVNLPRLTHFMEETNVGRGYIKELCYSPDGRLICSPYDKGIRLLGFSDFYEELTYCIPDRPIRLKNLVEMNNYHKGIVVSCKFNPKDLTLVSGCLSGEIVWYKPIL